METQEKVNLSVIPYVRSVLKTPEKSFLHSVASILPSVHIFIYTYKQKVLKNVVFQYNHRCP